jgi:erythrin-vacuolar iron transport family protein
MLGFGFNPQKRFAELGEREILALAITLEEEDGRIYRDFAEGLRGTYPASAKVFDAMAEEESGHRRLLIDLFRERFGEHIPLVRREDVRGFVRRKPIWLTQPLGLEAVRRRAEELEQETANFYREAAKQVSDAAVRKLLVDLAETEADHARTAHRLEERHLTEEARETEARTAHRAFVLQYVQPGLAGLMDGSVSTLAPLFAAAFATGSSWEAFLVGMAASIGAGISMGFAEALSDDGSLTGRGHPWVRGLVCGLMTTLGGVGHTLPYLIPDFRVATTLAVAVVLVELWAIAWVRARYMDTPFLQAAFQIVVGGALVFVSGIVIGSA